MIVKVRATHHPKAMRGDHKPKILKSITDDSYTQKQESLLDDEVTKVTDMVKCQNLI